MTDQKLEKELATLLNCECDDSHREAIAKAKFLVDNFQTETVVAVLLLGATNFKVKAKSEPKPDPVEKPKVQVKKKPKSS